MGKRLKKIKPVDRRIQKTKKLIFDALMDLILQKGYDSVTIQDIIDKANVGRSTFYSHFESKEQLLYGSHQELSNLLFSVNTNSKTEGIDFEALYTHAKEHSHVAKAMLGKKGGDIVITYLRDAMSFKLFNEMKKRFGKSKAEQKMLSFTAEACAAAAVRLLTCWLEDDMPFSPLEMAEKSQSIIHSMSDKSLGR